MIRFLFKAVVILGLLGFAIIGGYAVVTGESPGDIELDIGGDVSVQNDDDTEPQTAEGQGVTTLYGDQLLSSSDHIAEIRYYANGTLAIEFEPDHNTDGWVIIHEHHDSAADAIVSGETPEFSGPVYLTVEELGDIGEYPSATFRLESWDGSFTPWDEDIAPDRFTEQQGSVEFEIPEEPPGRSLEDLQLGTLEIDIGEAIAEDREANATLQSVAREHSLAVVTNDSNSTLAERAEAAGEYWTAEGVVIETNIGDYEDYDALVADIVREYDGDDSWDIHGVGAVRDGDEVTVSIVRVLLPRELSL